MEVDEDQWKPRDKLLLVEAVTTGAAAGGGSNGNRGDSGGQEGKRDVNWAAVSRLLRKHIPKKRLTTPTSFGSKRCMAMYDTLLARHGISAGAQGLSASNGPLAEGLDRVVAALREEYMNHLRKSIALCDSEIEKATERMTRINAGDLDEELLAHYEEEKHSRAAGQSSPAAASVVGTGASPPRKRRSLEGNGTSPLGASAVAPASPLPAGTDAPTSPLSPAQPPTKKARLEPPHAEEVTAVADTTTSTGVGHNGAPTEPPPAAPEASPPTEAEAEPTKAVAEAAESTAVESAEVGEPQGAPQLESDQTLSSSVPLETPTMTAMMLGMVEEPLPLPVVSSLSSAPASPVSFAQQETWTQQTQLLPTPDDLAASLAYHDPLLIETSAPHAVDAAESVELQLQPTAAEPSSRNALEAAEPLRPAEGEIDGATATATAPTSVTEDTAVLSPAPLVVSPATAPEEAGPKQDSLAPTAAALEGIKKGQPSPNAGVSFSTDLLWENFETEALPISAGEKGDHDDAMPEEAAKADTKAGPQGETQTEMDVEAASLSNRGKEVKEEREEAAMETEKEETRRDDTKAEVAQADVEKKKEEEQEEQEEEEEEPVVVEQKKPRGRPRRQSVNVAKRAYKRRKPAAEAEEKEAAAEAEAKTVVVIDDSDEEGVKVEDSASGEEATKRSMQEKRGKASSQQAKKETMKVEESEEEEEEEKKEAKNDEDEEESKAEKNENEEKEESEADDMEAEAEAAVRRVEMEGVRRVLATVKAHHYAKPFLQPVSVEDVPEYPNIIYRPMDFATITNRIKTGVISSKIEFLRDMYLLFQNAFIFNPKGSDIYVMASTLKTLTKAEMREVDREVEVVRASFPPAPRPKTKPASATTKAATPEPKKEATTAASRAAEANRKRRR